MKNCRYADFLGFLFTQQELMSKSPNMEVDPRVNLDVVHCTAAPPFVTDMQTISREVAWFSKVVTAANRSHIVSKPADLAKPGVKVVLGLQHPPQDAKGLKELLSLRKSGVLFMTLSYELESVYGGGFATPDVPLSAKGGELLRWMTEAGMVLDVSHVGHTTIRQALVLIERENLSLPVAATHTGCHAVRDHLRNLPDDILLGIKARNGIVGIPTATFMLDERDNTLQPFSRHIGHALGLLGEEHVAVGTDGIYKELDMKQMRELHRELERKIDPRGNFRARFPDQPMELNSPRRFDVVAGILSAKFGKKATVRIAGENIFSFLGRCLCPE